MAKKTELYRAAMAAALLALPSASAAAAALPVTSGSLTRDYARITFEWPKPVFFTAHANGKTLSITFERAADPDLRPLLAKLSPYILRATRARDGKTILLTLNKPYRIRTFISDNVGGIDLLDIQAKTPPKAPQVLAIAKQAERMAALAPAAGTPAAPAENVTTEKPKDDSSALPPDAKSAAVAGAVKVGISAESDSAVLRFPFTSRMAMAAFMRGNMLWIVFNKPVTLDLSEADSVADTIIKPPELLKGANVTVLRVPVDSNMYASAARQEAGFEWAVLVTPKQRPLAHALKADVNTDAPAPAHVFIPVLEAADAVTLQDPLIGDNLVVTPLYNSGEGIETKRDFVEFTLLETSQGVAVAKKADQVTVQQVRDGLRISVPNGASLTPGLPEVDRNVPADGLRNSPTLFPYAEWKTEDDKARRKEIQELFHTIVESGVPQEASRARLRLAEIYLSDGMAPEATAQLDAISRTDQAFYRSAKLAALRGAADFLLYRFTDAAKDFSATELNNNRETDYWRKMLTELLGGAAQNDDYLALNADYISKYPPKFRELLAIVAADRSIAGKEYNAALKIFDTLHEEGDIDIKSYIDFLMAKIAADTGREDEATDAWDTLAEDYDHPFVQARAEFTRIVWGMNKGTLTQDQVIDRLERLRLSWHGDSLEMEVLTMLGDLYADKKDYIDALRIWNGGVTGFPNTAMAIEMGHKMEATFVTLFNEGAADRMRPFDALAIYYEYRNFSPPGSSGNELIRQLADRLAMLDLLEQGASLLDHQMRFQAEKEERSSVGAKLAEMQLLDHQPKKALQALEDSVYGENSQPLKLARNRLTADAMARLEQPDKALLVLTNDSSSDAERIRDDIYWQEKDWPHLTASIEAMLKARPDITAPITLDESSYLLKLAIAYNAQNDKTQLHYLRDYFGPLMADNPNKQAFDFLTQGDLTLTPENFNDVMQTIAQTQAFTDHYSAHVQTAQAAPTPPPAVK